MAASDVETPLKNESTEAPQRQRSIARIAAVGACVLGAAAMVWLGASRRVAVAGVFHGVSLADAEDVRSHVQDILDDIYKGRNDTVKLLKDCLTADDWNGTARHAHQYDRLSEHIVVVQDWHEQVMKVYNALEDGAYEQGDMLLAEVGTVQCVANNKGKAIDLEHKLGENVDLSTSDGIENADLVISVLQKLQDACKKDAEGGESPPVDESGYLPAGNLSFTSGGSAKEVEQIVSVILAAHLGVDSSAVIAHATASAGDRRLAAVESEGKATDWLVSTLVAIPDVAGAFEEEMKAKLTALADEKDTLVEQLCLVLTDPKPDSFKLFEKEATPDTTENPSASEGGSTTDAA